MLITTQDTFQEYQIVKTLGLVRGNTVRARHIGIDIIAGLRTIVGGEVIEFTKLMAEAREQSIDRMVTEARSLGADGIVGVRFTIATIMSGSAELLVFGTAVKLSDSLSNT